MWHLVLGISKRPNVDLLASGRALHESRRTVFQAPLTHTEVVARVLSVFPLLAPHLPAKLAPDSLDIRQRCTYPRVHPWGPSQCSVYRKSTTRRVDCRIMQWYVLYRMWIINPDETP